MKTRKSMKTRIFAMLFALALCMPTVISAQKSEAATKPSISETNLTLPLCESQIVNIKGIKKKFIKKLTVSSSNKKAVKASKKGNMAINVVAESAGSATVTATISLKKKVSGKMSYKFKINVKVTNTVAHLEYLKGALEVMKKSGGTLTIDTIDVETVVIPKADYSNVSLVVNAPNAGVQNDAKFKSIEIQAINATLWKENANGNKISVAAEGKTPVEVEEKAELDSISFLKGSPSSDYELVVRGKVNTVNVECDTQVSIDALIQDAYVGQVNIKALDSKVTVNANEEATVAKVRIEKYGDIFISGKTANKILIESISNVNLTVSGTLLNVERTTIEE